MIVLAVDTATQSCSVAIVDDGQLLAEMTTAKNRTHSVQLMDIINKVCSVSELAVTDIDGFAVTVGPGSFTGLRIGISTIKGLAWSLNKPVVGISSLDALAWQCIPSNYLICPLLDARKNEVYYCRYHFLNDDLQKNAIEAVAGPIEAVRGIEEPCLLVGTGALLYQEKLSTELGELAFFASQNQHVLRASSVASLSIKRFDDQKTDDVELLVPHYIRKSDAELKNSDN